MTMNFAELQTKMQVSKTSKKGVKYSFRNAEDIFTHFKTLNSGWEINVSDDLVEVGGRVFIKPQQLQQKMMKFAVPLDFRSLTQYLSSTQKIIILASLNKSNKCKFRNGQERLVPMQGNMLYKGYSGLAKKTWIL